ncbi:MAG: hypothetical protein U0794_04650 [Isosphaeraceae bacterium]
MRTLNSEKLARLAFLTAFFALVPAVGCSAGGLRGDGRSLRQRFADRIAYRPVYPEANPVPRTRPLYLSGYAGAQYGRERRTPVYPSTYQWVPSPWAAWLHHEQP